MAASTCTPSHADQYQDSRRQDYHSCVLPSDTIDNIKDQIEDKKDIPTFQQHLFLNGFELQNGHTLLDYHVPDGAEIRFIWRGSGGGIY